MNDKIQRRNVNATGCNVSRNTDTGLTGPQALDRAATLVLPHFARNGDGGEPTLQKSGLHLTNHHTGVAEHHGRRALVETQNVYEGTLDFLRGRYDATIGNVRMLLGAGNRIDALGIFLEALGQRGNFTGNRRREQQRAALGRGRIQKLFQLVTEAHIQHFVSFIEHDATQTGQVKRTTGLMITQAARRPNDDMGATVEIAGFTAGIRATNAARNAGTGLGIEPFKFGLDLKGQFTRRGNNQSQRLWRRREAISLTKQRRRNSQTKSYGLA